MSRRKSSGISDAERKRITSKSTTSRNKSSNRKSSVRQPIIKLTKGGGETFATKEQKEKTTELRKTHPTEKFEGEKKLIEDSKRRNLESRERRSKERRKGFDIKEYRERDTIGGKIVKAATSLKTTAVLGTIAAGLGAAGAIGGATATAEAGELASITRTALKGRQSLTTQTGFMGKGISKGSQLLFKAGRNLQKIRTAGAPAFNAKTMQATESILAKAFSKKTLATLGAGAGAMFLGQWGQAEAAEPISIVMRDILKEAKRTGDWSLYEEAVKARSELTDLKTWEKIALWTPASPLIGIPHKIQGAIKGGIIMDRLAEDLKIQQETGESEDDKWERINQNKREEEKASIDYYNNERRKLLEWEANFKKQGNTKESNHWKEERGKTYKREKEEKEANEKFWRDYRKESQKLEEENRLSLWNKGKSTLKFGMFK